MFAKGAFECEKCPRSNDPAAVRFCPAWWEEPWYDKGKEVVRKDCSYRMLPLILRTIAETNALTLTTNHTMNAKLDKTEEMCNHVSEQMGAVAKALIAYVDMKTLEHQP